MAPATSVLDRVKKLLKRGQTWLRKRTTAVTQPAAPSNKASLPEQPKEAPQQPNKPQDKSSAAKANTMPTLQIALQNQTNSPDVYAYISKIMSNYVGI